MKKYKFLIKKTKEMEIELCAENHSEAMFELLQKAVKKLRKIAMEKEA